MNYISTTGLRTKSSELINTLLAGKSVDLFHRSKLVGRVVPIEEEKKIKHKPIFSKDLPHIEGLTLKKAMANYDKHMQEKYGKYFR